MFADNISIMALAAAITTIGGAILVVQRIGKNYRKEREHESAKVLQAAKEEDALIKAKLEARIEGIKSDLKNLELNVNKDFEHIRETYNGEIRNLGQKIEELRSELRNQHGQLVALLTKMIGDRD